MSTFTVGVNYCWQGRSIGTFKELLTLDVGKRTIQWGQFEKGTVHQNNFKEVKPCSIGGKTRRHRNRKQRKTRRH